MAESKDEKAKRLAREALKREAMKVHPKPDALKKIQKRIEKKKGNK